MTKAIVYTSSTCLYCTMAKDYLEERSVDVEERNVRTDAAARSGLMEKGYTGIPVIVIGDEKIVGFDKAKLEKILDK